MHAFKDKAGRDWNIEIALGTVKRVKGLLKNSAGEPRNIADEAVDGSLLSELFNNSEALADVLWAILEPQAKTKGGVTREMFDDSFAGDVITAGFEAFSAELADFFHEPRRQWIVEQTKAVRETETLSVAKAIASVSKENLEKAVNQIASTTSAGGSPESLGATQPA